MSARPPPHPRPAASLILLRSGAEGLEVLVGRRSAAARAFPGATVFPGGKIDSSDREACTAGCAAVSAARWAVLRESFEETGLLITNVGDGPPPSAEVRAAMQAVESRALSFVDLVRQWGVRPGVARLTPFAHWITPEAAPYRFDTQFFALEASSWEASAPLVCGEFESLSWSTPRAVLADPSHRLITPTRHCLGVLATSPTPDHAIAAAKARGVIDGAAVRAAV